MCRSLNYIKDLKVMFCPSLIAHLIKMEISLSQEVMIEPVKFGILKLEILFILYKDIRMLFIVWLLMFLMEIRLLLVHLIRLLNYGAAKLESYYLPMPDMKVKL
jgi:hypothetical protein